MTRKFVRPVEITGIEGESEKGIWVTIKETGKLAWLPKRLIEIWPQQVMIPDWLAVKIGLAPM